MLRRSLLLAALSVCAEALVLPADAGLGLPATGLVLPSAGLNAVGDVFSGNTDESAAAPANAAVPADRQAYFSQAELGVSGSGAASNAKRKGPSKRVGYLTLQAGLSDPLAVCNDGSPANYYYRKGSDPTNWLIYLEGGMWCYSEATCTARNQSTPWEMSNSKLAPNLAVGGIFSTSHKNPWAAANVAYVPYCSSDAWVGDAAASEWTWGYAFRGQRILAGVIASLVKTQGMGGHTGLGLASQTRLLLTGCSAGARGAMMNLDYVQEMLGVAGLSEGAVSVQGLLDSPLWVDVAPLQPHVMPLANETRAAFEIFNATARLGPLCATTYPDPGDQWRCMFGQWRMPLLQTPYMLNAAQDDKFELPYNLGGNTPLGYNVAGWHADQVAYANAFGPQVLAVVNTLPTTAQKKSAVFSTACFRHCVTDSAAFWNVGIAQAAAKRGPPSLPVSLADAANAWYFGKVPSPFRIVQQCTGFRCGDCSTKLAKHLEKEGAPGALDLSGGPLAGVSRAHLVEGVVGVIFLTLTGVCCVLAFAGTTATSEIRQGADGRVRKPSNTAHLYKPIVGFKKVASGGGMTRPGVRYGERSPLLDEAA